MSSLGEHSDFLGSELGDQSGMTRYDTAKQAEAQRTSVSLQRSRVVRRSPPSSQLPLRPRVGMRVRKAKGLRAAESFRGASASFSSALIASGSRHASRAASRLSKRDQEQSSQRAATSSRAASAIAEESMLAQACTGRQRQAHATLCVFCLAFLIWRLRTGRRRVEKGKEGFATVLAGGRGEERRGPFCVIRLTLWLD